MSVAVLIGAQWGDEGKGKATDLLGKKIDYSVKYNGGNNAGHTVVINGKSYSLHLLPTGVFYKDVTPIIANGVVVDLKVLFDEEIKMLNENNFDTSKIVISSEAHIIPSYNKILDSATERSLGKRKIGTTGRGIGPTYADKMNRISIRIQDLFDTSILKQKINSALEQKNLIIEKVYGLEPVKPNVIYDEIMKYAKDLDPIVKDTPLFINNAIDNNKNILFEGCQATMLDIDHGTYPYVTSSNTIAGGACSGAGIPPTKIDKVLGVTKAYTTRVGEGPFPTEDLGEMGEFLRKAGAEYGATTGRPRRCGFFDALVVKYAVKINGLTDLVLTKIDVLSTFKKIPVCTAYDIDGKIVDELPVFQTAFHHAKPVYEYLDGWQSDISNITEYEKLPVNAQKYIEYLEKICGCKISIIGTGAARESVIDRSNIF
jgi:adenylosuccinate synthase